MTAENIKAEEVFHEAIEITDQVKRSAYLDRACGQGSDLRVEVEALLRAHEEAGNFLEPPTLAPKVTEESPVIEGPGTRIGRYEVLELIGEGGMGMVYLAEQKEPVRRRVALKIIKPGMDSKQVVARFEAERQALALLDHPNIAHVFDADTTETGRPYFVMEYVRGMSITEYSDERRLNIEQRLRLFEQVCEGIHHAHQKGIIHRDLKPTNVLVSVHGDRAVPKIIDFGIAKAITHPLTEKTFVTFQGQLLGTPEYMSPEQVDLATQDIDTRSDIYSLGVVLYELLAGVLPFEKESFKRAGFAEVQRTIREQEPASPSIRLTNLGERAKTIAASRNTQVITLARRLHRELEWIPLKAMRKDRCRRYRSASEMADDVRNYINGLPLIAGPETAVYRAKKFVQKHAGSVATVALVAAVIVLGLIVSTAMYFRTEKALQKEAIARSQAEKAEKVASEQQQIAEEETKRARELAETQRKQLYFNRIALAEVAYRNKDLTHACELLKACPEDLRGWEWDRLNHISSDQSLMTLRGHTDRVYGVAVSPDGKYIASGSRDKTIKVWNAATGAELMTLRGHNEGVGPVSFSPDGKQIVSGSHDKTVKIWDWTTGAELRTLQAQHEGFITDSRFSPDGKHILSWGGDNTIKVWDAETGQELAALRAGESVYGLSAAAFSPDSKRIVSANTDKIVRVWDWTTDDEPMILRGHDDIILSTAFSPDGKRIVSGSIDETIKIWDAENGTEVMTIDTGSRVLMVGFSPDGKQIISTKPGTCAIKIWDSATGDELMTLQGHENRVAKVVFSPDGKRVVSSSYDKTIKVWDVAIDRNRTTLRGCKENSILSLAFSPDGRRIVSGGRDAKVKVYDTISGAEIMTLPGHSDGIWSVVYTIDGTRIISSSRDGTIKVWDAVSGAELAAFSNPDRQAIFAAPSPDGRTVVFNSRGDNNLRIWDLSVEGRVKTFCKHKRWPSCVAYSPDGKYIVSGDIYGAVKIWDVITGSEMMTLKTSRPWSYMECIAFSPDGRRIVTGGDELKIWNIETGTEEMALQGHGVWTDSVAFSPDGKRIIAACASGGLKIWKASTGAEIFSPNEGKNSRTVAISPDGKTIATNDDENNIILLESTVPADGYKSRLTAQASRKIVDELYEKHGLYSEVINKLKADNTLDEAVRKVALQIANAHLWEDAEKQKEQGQDPSPKEIAGSED
jgi:WD40 repeat protein/tRNA A-37 threonylcarbamoyl transferase component Bud32